MFLRQSLACLFVLIFVHEISAQELAIPPSNETPKSLSKSVLEYHRRVQKAREVYLEAVDRANQVLTKDVGFAQRRAMKSKDTDEIELLNSFSKTLHEGNLKGEIEWDWTVIFRGVTAEHWNTDHPEDRDGVAISLDRPIPIRFLRVTNLANKQSVILRCQVKLPELAEEFDIDDEWVWNGKKQFWGTTNLGMLDRAKAHGWRFGLANKKWTHGYKEKATIAGPKYGYGGFGFGRMNLINEHGFTQYMWADELVPAPFQIEVSVTSKQRVSPSDGKLVN